MSKYPGSPLKLGSRGIAVGQLQKQLNKYDGEKLTTDREFGPQTARKVENFQTNRKLGTDGIVDHVIWNRIFELPAPKLHPRKPETVKDRLRRLRVELPHRQREVKAGKEGQRRRLNKVKAGIRKTLDALTPKGPRVVGNTVIGGTPRQRLVDAAYSALSNYQHNPARWFYSQPGGWTVAFGITGPPWGYRSDCSQWVTALYKSAGLPDPNGQDYGGGYTGTLANHGRQISRSQLRPGDLVIWDPWGPSGHVEIYTGPGDLTIGHGSAPIKQHNISDFSYKPGGPRYYTYL
jgi:peptidoglycan hydrolase-like protein with peptidoglycan-binding domain